MKLPRTTTLFRRLPLAASLLAATAIASSPPTQRPKDTNPPRQDIRLLPANGKVGKETFAALTARWWRWALSMPVKPYLDPDGRLCELGQKGPVWFLAGTDGSFSAKRHCAIPEGKFLLIPVINMMQFNDNPNAVHEDPFTCAGLQEGAAVNNDRLAKALVMIDNVPIPHVTDYRVRSEGCFRLDPDNPASPLAAADGYWLLLKPLPVGRHTISVGANYNSKDGEYGKMVQFFQYTLVVGGDSI